MKDINFFLKYLAKDNSNIDSIKNISVDLINEFTARDFNYFIGEYCSRYEVFKHNHKIIYENHNRSLSRKICFSIIIKISLSK